MSAPNKKTSASQSSGSRPAPSPPPNQSTHTTQETEQKPLPNPDLRARQAETLLDQRTRLEQLATSFDDILRSLTEQREANLHAVQKAAELTPILKRVAMLATRLSSSLKTDNMKINALGSYRHAFDTLCFMRFAEMARISPLTARRTPKRSRIKLIDSAKIHGLIFDCLREKYPETKIFLPVGRNLVDTFRRLQRGVESAKAILAKDSATQTKSSIERHLAEPLKLIPEGTAALSVFCSWISDSEFQTDVTQAVAALSKDIRDKILEITDSPTPPVPTIDTSLSEDRLPEDTV